MKKEFVFKKENYILLLAGILIITIGFMLMVGGGAKDSTSFSEEIFSPRRITVAPIVCLIGYTAIIVAILYKPKAKS